MITGNGSGLTGVSANAGGANTQVQYNNSGAIAGSTDFVFDNTNHKLTLSTTNAPTGDALQIANSPKASGTNALLTLGGTDIATGNTNGTYIGANAVNSNPDFINFEVGGAIKFRVDGSGNLTALGTISGNGSGLTGLSASSITSGVLSVAEGGTGTGTGSITGTGPLTFTAGGTNQSVTLTPSGTGSTILGGSVGIGTTTPANRLQVSWVSGDTATTASFGSGSGSDNQVAVSATTGTANAITAVSLTGPSGVSGSTGGAGAGVVGTGTGASSMGVIGQSGNATSGFFQSTSANSSVATLVARGQSAQTGDIFNAQNSGGTIFFNVSSSGQVGIGAQFPAAALDVESGNINMAVSSSFAGAITQNGQNLMHTYSPTAGQPNFFAGQGAGNFTMNTSAQSNVGVGDLDLSKLVSGARNAAVGYQALYQDTIGGSNSALGFDALTANLVGSDNTAVGANALFSNSASDNTAVGYASLAANTSGSFNVAVGGLAGTSNQSGNYVTAVGYQAAQSTTVNQVTAIGAQALYTNNTGIDNVAVGYQALYLMNGAGNNTAVGDEALAGTTSGGNNVAVGEGSGITNQTGSLNTFIGYQANATAGSTNLSNATAIGANAQVGENDAIVLGSAGVSVGIGTSFPAYPLDVVGPARVGHLVGGSNTPTVVLGTGAGTAPTSTAVSGTDLGMQLSFTAGSSPAANAIIATITFGNSFGALPHCVFSAANASASNFYQVWISSASDDTITLNSGSGVLSAGSTYVWNIMCVQ